MSGQDDVDIHDQLLEARGAAKQITVEIDSDVVDLPPDIEDADEITYTLKGVSRDMRNECLSKLPNALVQRMQSDDDDFDESDVTADMVPPGDATLSIEAMVTEGLNHGQLSTSEMRSQVKKDFSDEVLMGVWGEVMKLSSASQAITGFRVH